MNGTRRHVVKDAKKNTNIKKEKKLFGTPLSLHTRHEEATTDHQYICSVN